MKAGQCGPEKGSLGPPARAAAPATRPRISGLKMRIKDRPPHREVMRGGQGVNRQMDDEPTGAR